MYRFDVLLYVLHVSVSVWCLCICLFAISCISFMYQFSWPLLVSIYDCISFCMFLFDASVWLYTESQEKSQDCREKSQDCREKSRDVWLNMSREDTMPLEKSRDYSCDMSVCGLYVCLYVTLSHEIFMLLMQIYIYNLYVTKLYASLLLYIKYWDMKYFFTNKFHLITDSFSRTKTLSFSSPSHSPHQNYSHGIFIP